MDKYLIQIEARKEINNGRHFNATTYFELENLLDTLIKMSNIEIE